MKKQPLELGFVPYKLPTGPPTHPTKHNNTNIIKKLTVGIVQTYNRCDPKYTCKYGNMPKRILTQPSEGVDNDGYDNVNFDYIFSMYDEIRNDRKEEEYVVEEIVGKGTFGQVMLCRNSDGERVAVKVVKNRPAYQNQAILQIKILRQINKMQAKSASNDLSYKVVSLLDAFVWRKHLCLVFELLQNSLYDVLKQADFQGLDLQWIKVWARQILQGIVLFHDMGIIHCDLKPQNLMFVKDSKKPNSKLKIIDFGSSCYNHQTVYSYIQSRFYRAPEIILGSGYSNKIDMWSFGCILVELYLGLPIFPGNSMYDQLRKIISILGVPPDRILKAAKQTSKYFVGEPLRLKSEEQYENTQGVKLPPSKNYYRLKNLDELITSKAFIPEAQRKDHLIFIDFVKKCLQLDPERRMSAREALDHKFIGESKGGVTNGQEHLATEIKQNACRGFQGEIQ